MVTIFEQIEIDRYNDINNNDCNYIYMYYNYNNNNIKLFSNNIIKLFSDQCDYPNALQDWAILYEDS